MCLYDCSDAQRCALAARVVEGYCACLNVNYVADEMDVDGDDEECSIANFIKSTLVITESSALGVERSWFSASKMEELFEDETQRDMSVKVLDYFEDVDCGITDAILECGGYVGDDGTVTL